MDHQKASSSPQRDGEKDHHHHGKHHSNGTERRSSKPDLVAGHGTDGGQARHSSQLPAVHHPHKLPSIMPDVQPAVTAAAAERHASTESQRVDKLIKISDVIKIPVPKVIVCRIFGVTSSESVGELLYKYFVMKVPIYLSNHWADADAQEAVSKIRESIEESKVKDFPVIPPTAESKEKVIEAVAKFVEVMSDPKLDQGKKKAVNPSFTRLRSLIISAGMRSKDIENSHVYDDIPPAFKVWTESGIRIATISSTTKDTQKDCMTYTNHGDISSFISDTISLMNPHLQTGDPKSPDFRNMCKKVLQVEPTSVLLLTSKISEAKAGQKCSMEVVLVSREERIGKKPIADIKRESVKDIPVVKSMQSIVLTK